MPGLHEIIDTQDGEVIRVYESRNGAVYALDKLNCPDEPPRYIRRFRPTRLRIRERKYGQA